jgi:Spy/CpxP family protein refolding chaperone
MRSKWLIGALAVSVVVNLLLAGFVVGRMSGDFGIRGGIGPVPQLKFLEEDRRREVFQGLETRRALKPKLRKLRAAQRDMRAALLAEPFEQEALSETLAEFRRRLDESQALSHQKFVSVVSRLTPDERRKLASTLDRHRKPPDRRPPRRERQPEAPSRSSK